MVIKREKWKEKRLTTVSCKKNGILGKITAEDNKLAQEQVKNVLSK